MWQNCHSELEESGNWSDPINIGFPINTTSDNLFYYPLGSGNEGYYARVDKEEPLNFDLYHVRIMDRKAKFRETPEPSRFNRNFQMLIIHPALPDTLILYYNREKDIFTSGDPEVQLKIMKNE